jgi:hypothetical protein
MEARVMRTERKGHREVVKGYHRRTVLGVAAYVVVLAAAVAWLNANEESAWRVPVALLPLLPMVYGLWNIMLHFRGSDELHQRIQLESLAFGFAGTAMALFTYGFLEMVGFPRVSVWWVWTAMGSFWVIGTFLSRRRYG